MNTSIITLFTVAIRHAYYSGPCSDFEFVIPPSTADVLRGGKLLARVVEGQLHVLYEREKDRIPIISIAGETLTFGLRLVNPWFSNFTVPVISDRKLVPFYANSGDPKALDPPLGTALVSGVYAYTPQTATRPLTARLMDSRNQVVATETVVAGVSDISFDLRRLSDGLYKTEEGPGAGSPPLIVSAELRNAGVWGIVSVKVDAGFYAAPPPDVPPQDAAAKFVVDFEARTEQLKYFVVADKYSDLDFLALKVKDAGFVDDNRTEVEFKRVESGEFSKANDDIFPPSLLGEVERVVMFRSLVPVARRARGLRKIQLTRREDESGILIENLPLPGADRPQAHFIVHLSKP